MYVQKQQEKRRYEHNERKLCMHKHSEKKKNYMYQQTGENYAQTRGEKTINKLNVRKL